MGHISNSTAVKSMPLSLERQACVRAIRRANISSELKKEADAFILRNTLPDCGLVPPNCLKAHLINSAKKLGYHSSKIKMLKQLFKSKIGYEGYYLDAGKLKKV